MLCGMTETCTEVTSSHRVHELPSVLPLRTTHKVPVIVHEDVKDTKIWSDYINVSLYWYAGWKKGTTPFCKRMSFNFHDFYEFSKTCSQFPWLFQAWKKTMEFHDFFRFSMIGYTLFYVKYLFTMFTLCDYLYISEVLHINTCLSFHVLIPVHDSVVCPASSDVHCTSSLRFWPVLHHPGQSLDGSGQFCAHWFWVHRSVRLPTSAPVSSQDSPAVEISRKF